MSATLPRETASGREAERKVIVFLVRHFNDIDHVVPIVYRMLKDSAARVELFCMDPFLDIGADTRIRFLEQRFSCKPSYIYQAHAPSLLHRLFGFLVGQTPYLRWPRGLRWVSRIARSIAYRLYNSGWTLRLYDKKWAKGWLQSSKVDRLVFDFRHKRGLYAAIADASEELGVGKIGVPQGIEFSMDRDWTNKRVATQNPNVLQDNWGWVGEFVVAGEHVKAMYAQLGIPSERITVLGSARYCQEWIDVYHRMLGPGPLTSDDGKLKVVYMDHSAEYRVDTEAVVVKTQEELEHVWELRQLGTQVAPNVVYQNKKRFTFDVERLGFRDHMPNLHAAIGIEQLKKMDRIAKAKREACIYYNERFSRIKGVKVPTSDFSDIVPFLYYLRIEHGRRDEFRDYRRENGVGTGLHWVPNHKLSLLQQYRKGDVSVAERIGNEIVTIPLFTEISREQQDYIIESVNNFFRD